MKKRAIGKENFHSEVKKLLFTTPSRHCKNSFPHLFRMRHDQLLQQEATVGNTHYWCGFQAEAFHHFAQPIAVAVTLHRQACFVTTSRLPYAVSIA